MQDLRGDKLRLNFWKLNHVGFLTAWDAGCCWGRVRGSHQVEWGSGGWLCPLIPVVLEEQVCQRQPEPRFKI